MKSKNILNGRTIGVAVLVGLLVGAVISDAQVIRGNSSQAGVGGAGNGVANILAVWSNTTTLTAANSTTQGVGIGVAGTTSSRLRIAGSYTLGTSDAEVGAVVVGGSYQLTGASSRGSLIRLAGTIIEHSSGAPTYITALDCAPTFTNGGAATNTASCLHVQTFAAPTGATFGAGIYVAAAPTGASNNYSLWVDAGNSRLDGNLEIQGGLSLVAAGTAVTGAILGTEISDPSAPSANQGVLYFRDNGASKTQLVVRFPTGAIQVIATEP